MKKFKYTAINLSKEKFSGTFLAKDEKDLAAQLAKQDLFLVSSSIASEGSPSAFFTLGTGEVSIGELTTFCRQFSIMIDAGITVLEALESLKSQAFSSYFKSLLAVIYEDVQGGVMLSAALERHRKVFPDFFRSMVYVGEVSGKLDLVFKALADYYDKDYAIKRKTKSAFAYPIILLIMTIGIAILMLVGVVPTFRSALSDLEIVPTGITKAVYDLSEFVLANWLYILAGICVIGIAIFVFSITKVGKFFFDTMKITIPVLRKVNIDIITARFGRAFALLLSSGIDITEALDTVGVILGNQAIELRFRRAAEEIKHGAKLSESFQKYNIFPSMMLMMLAVGERTAQLDNVLNRTSNFFDDQVEASINSAVSTLQPIMLCLLGVVVGVMFIAVYSPMISIMTTL